MITTVDRSRCWTVQKVSHNGKLIRYQLVSDAGDHGGVIPCSSLAEARAFIGKSQNGKPLVTSKS